MGNAKTKNNTTQKEISWSLVHSRKLITIAKKYPKGHNIINVAGSSKASTTAVNIVGGPLLVDVGTATTTARNLNTNKTVKYPQQTQNYNHNTRQQKAADNSATSSVAEQQRLKQASSFWSLGSLTWNLSYSGRNSYKQHQKSHRKNYYSTLQYQRKRSKTQWHKPLTNAIFSSHFNERSRNEEFHIDQLVAKGAFGVVFKVTEKISINDECQKPKFKQLVTTKTTSSHPPVYALKVLKKYKIIDENCLQQIKDEVDIQKLCGHHPFIVEQFDLWQNRYNLHILSEYMPKGELFSTIQTFSLNLIRLYLAEIALALDFLHNAGVIYRDAKPENILLTQDYHLKLTDFGLSKWLKLGLTTKTMCGTFQYMAPEIFRGESYTHAVDWWSLGIIVCQMFVKRSPDIRQFLTINLPEHLQPSDAVDHVKFLNATTHNINLSLNAGDGASKLLEVDKFLPPEVENLCHEGKDVLKRLLEFDAQKRIRSVRVLQRVAMYKDFKIEADYCLKIHPWDIIAADNIIIRQNYDSIQISADSAHEAFQNF